MLDAGMIYGWHGQLRNKRVKEYFQLREWSTSECIVQSNANPKNTHYNSRTASPSYLRPHSTPPAEHVQDADVSRVMASWSQYLQTADRIFVQTGSADAKSIFSADAIPHQASNSGESVF
eukprot:474526-Pelagomonas_calceolata.AAC.1